MNEDPITLTLSAADLNAVIVCLHDVADIRRSQDADDLLRDLTVVTRASATLPTSWRRC